MIVPLQKSLREEIYKECSSLDTTHQDVYRMGIFRYASENKLALFLSVMTCNCHVKSNMVNHIKKHKEILHVVLVEADNKTEIDFLD